MEQTDFNLIMYEFYMASEHLSNAISKIEAVDGTLRDVEVDRFLLHAGMSQRKIGEIVNLVCEKKRLLKSE